MFAFSTCQLYIVCAMDTFQHTQDWQGLCLIQLHLGQPVWTERNTPQSEVDTNNLSPRFFPPILPFLPPLSHSLSSFPSICWSLRCHLIPLSRHFGGTQLSFRYPPYSSNPCAFHSAPVMQQLQLSFLPLSFFSPELTLSSPCPSSVHSLKKSLFTEFAEAELVSLLTYLFAVLLHNNPTSASFFLRLSR